MAPTIPAVASIPATATNPTAPTPTSSPIGLGGSAHNAWAPVAPSHAIGRHDATPASLTCPAISTSSNWRWRRALRPPSTATPPPHHHDLPLTPMMPGAHLSTTTVVAARQALKCSSHPLLDLRWATNRYACLQLLFSLLSHPF
jgi:hypothetical protein